MKGIVALVFIFVFAQVVVGDLCQCTYRSGNLACINEATVSSCDDCEYSSCNLNSSCYAASSIFGQSTGSTCWSSLSLFKIEKTKYKVVHDILGGHCDQDDCCCLVGDVTISRNGPSISISGKTKGNGEDCGKDIQKTYTSTFHGDSFIFLPEFLQDETALIIGTSQELVISSPYSPSCVTRLEHTGVNKGLIAGVIIGVIAGVVIITVVVIVVIRRRRNAVYSPLLHK